MGQTAVELLEDGINKVLSHLPLEREDIKTLIQQAKEMEKEQMKESFNEALYQDVDNAELLEFEQYYNKTFKSE
jgi:hypothetical protein